jgi:hypothetical protein
MAGFLCVPSEPHNANGQYAIGDAVAHTISTRRRRAIFKITPAENILQP